MQTPAVLEPGFGSVWGSGNRGPGSKRRAAALTGAVHILIGQRGGVGHARHGGRLQRRLRRAVHLKPDGLAVRLAAGVDIVAAAAAALPAAVCLLLLRAAPHCRLTLLLLLLFIALLLPANREAVRQVTGAPGAPGLPLRLQLGTGAAALLLLLAQAAAGLLLLLSL